jgi:predicted TIM-barrel fold metal-dependent hydrolase
MLDRLAIDADNHYYEPPDAFTRYMASADLPLAVRTERRDGENIAMVADRPYTFFAEMFWEHVGEPGSLRARLRGMQAGIEGAELGFTQLRPEFVDKDARLSLMTEQGIEACIMFPTLAVCVEHFMDGDPEVTYKNFRAFNRWLEEDWGYGRNGRIFGVPMLSLVDVDLAVAELEHVIDRGAKVVGLRAGPAFGRSPGDPYFDPFWERVNEARLVVAFHIGESGYNQSISVAWGEQPNPSSHTQSAFQWTCFYGDRPLMDTMASLVYYNLFGRFPDVRVASVENGSVWVPYLMKAMNKMNGMGRNGPWPGGRLTEKPSEIFRRHVSVSPYHEEDIVGLTQLIGASQVLFGSDYPHAEGLADPVSFVDNLTSLPDDEQRMIMRSNTAQLIGLAA